MGLKSYDFEAKQAWRIWQYNRILDMLSVVHRLKFNRGIQTSDLVTYNVLYLCGPDDIDGRFLSDRGFNKARCIPVEKDLTIVTQLRSVGVNVWHSSLENAMLALPIDAEVHIVLADFCCGITNAIYEFIDCLLFSGGLASPFVLSVNLLRGRDRIDDLQRGVLRRIKQRYSIKPQSTPRAFERYADPYTNYAYKGPYLLDPIKHRGYLFDICLQRRVVEIVNKTSSRHYYTTAPVGWTPTSYPLRLKSDLLAYDDMIENGKHYAAVRKALCTYNSIAGNQQMDGLVRICWPLSEEIKKLLRKPVHIRKRTKAILTAKRKLSAFKAVSTVKQKVISSVDMVSGGNV